MSSASVIGERIKSLREKRNLSRESFCTEVGITQSSLSMYENGQRVPRDEIKVKIARLLGVSIEALFFTD
ncbi:MAG: helix-turn-helix transcriptional regulator [Ruminococcus sp.]|nr:helix-turn-helix transcriptional regulator [Ruminococcus sp.]